MLCLVSYLLVFIGGEKIRCHSFIILNGQFIANQELSTSGEPHEDVPGKYRILNKLNV